MAVAACLEYDPLGGVWELAYDGSGEHPAWPRADLDAVHGTADPGPGPPAVFGQTVLALANKTDFVWVNPVDWVAVRGDFVSSTDVGDYAFDAEASGDGLGVTDAEVPDPDSGFWYLFRLGGCAASSWQTTLGDEPGRDTALP